MKVTHERKGWQSHRQSTKLVSQKYTRLRLEQKEPDSKSMCAYRLSVLLCAPFAEIRLEQESFTPSTSALNPHWLGWTPNQAFGCPSVVGSS